MAEPPQADIPPTDPAADSVPVDKVRASRAGHAFHEAWAARSALALLPPDTSLTAIAVEGLGREDEGELGPAAIEIADLTRYHGGRSVTAATRIEIVQFKYSIASKDKPVRAADLRATLVKFALGDAERRAKHGDVIADRVVYEFATNRPIDRRLHEAIDALIADAPLTGDTARQADQIREALKPYALDSGGFLARLSVLGALGSLDASRQGLRRTIANWSAPGEAQTRIRLRALEHLVREKAGMAGLDDKVIDRVAVLDAFELDDENLLYPTPDAFPAVEKRIERPILDAIVARARATSLPLLVHGEGGMGKTVLMQALADRLGETHLTVLFDGYGAGKWRDPAHPRHLASHSLVHLANILASEGLCDLMLPATQEDSLLRAFRLRLSDAVRGVRQRDPAAGVALLLDAIDHAALAARDGTHSFAHLLLRSLAIEPIDGVIVVASCRTERRQDAAGGADHIEFPIPAFSHDEARQLILARDPTASEADIAALETRSGRNPRCLDAFLAAGQPYDGHGPVEGDAHTVLDALIAERITAARQEAMRRGATGEEVDTLLAGLAMLPPPVPLEELAAAQGLSVSTVESFATDLAPLLERTRHGLMFRDEPTETLIGKMAEQDDAARDAVVERLAARQDRSDYAARALPLVLTLTGRVDALVDLAFDARVPGDTSEVGKREIRIARLVAAAQTAARHGRTDDLFRLALEASLVAAGHERADRFLYEHPDLTALSQDSESLRRLFTTRIGWSGGRQSALAIAYALAGEAGEAQRHAARAIDWYNHRLHHPRESSGGLDQVSAAFDEIGFAYVELLKGGARRIFDWLRRNNTMHAYHVIAGILDLGDCHSAGGSDPPDMARVRRMLSRCRLQLHGAAAAALSRSNGDPTVDRRFLDQLAMPSDTPDRFPDEALLHAALRAVDLGMVAAARAIFDRVDARTQTAYSFDDYRAADLSAVHALIAAGVAAALKRRPVGLVDIAPRDLLALVPPSQRDRGPAAFARALAARLKGKPVQYPKRRTKVRRDDDARRHMDHLDRQQRLLDHRITPILPYADRVRQLIRAAPAQRPALISAWLDQLEQHVRTATNYPFRDGAAFIARMGGLALVMAGSVTAKLDEPSALRLAELLSQDPQIPIAPLLWALERLSRLPACHAAVMRLAARVEQGLLEGTDIAARLRDYGQLARAVWRISPADAAAYFRRGLDLAEAMGSDDFERANSMLQLATNYRGPALIPEAGQALARIFELQLGDDDRYPWGEWASAMRGVAGLGAIPIITRIDDRNAARLSLTLPPLLAALVEAGTMPADIATALVGIGGAKESRDWGLDRFAKAALETLPQSRIRQLFDILLVEIDREDGLSPYPKTVARLAALAESRFAPDDPLRRRLTALQRPLYRDDAPPIDIDRTPEGAPVTKTALGDANAIDAAIDADTADRKGHPWPKRVLRVLAERAAHPMDRLAFLEALGTVISADLDDKLWALAPLLDAWAAQSPAIRQKLPAIGTALAQRHGNELAGTSWDVIQSWRRLTGQFGLARDAIAKAAIAGLGSDALEASGEQWLSLAAELSPATSQDALAIGLERFLLLVGKDIPEEIGDGGWSPNFAAEGGAVAVAAGLLWARLGHPAMAMRWRATHALLRMARLGRFDVVEAVIARYGQDAGAFSAPRLPFFAMHAQLWLLFALERIARDYPCAIAPHCGRLERIATSSDFPHPAIREAARRTLEALLPSLAASEAEALAMRIVLANRSRFAPLERQPFYGDVYASRPAGEGEADEVHLEYDFGKYQIAKVMRLFRVEPWKVRERLTQWVRRWDAKIASMYDDPRPPRYGDDRSGSWSGGHLPQIDRYGSYLAWHALQLTAGELLAERPVVTKGQWYDDSWQSYLGETGLTLPDGTWLAEWSDLTPSDLAREVPMPARNRLSIHDAADARILAPMVGISETQIIARRLVVAGRWTAPDDVDIAIDSVLAPKQIARAVLLAALMVEPFYRSLPFSDRDREHDFPGEPLENGVHCWISTDDHHDSHLDRFDPYAARTAQYRPYPNAWLQTVEAVVRDDPAGRSWSQGGIPILFGEAWGGADSRDGDEGYRGERLSVDPAWLTGLIGRHGFVLVGLAKAQLYRKKDRDDVEGGFIHRAHGFLIDARGRVDVPQRVPRAVSAAIRQLGHQDHYDYGKRFRAIARAFAERRPG